MKHFFSSCILAPIFALSLYASADEAASSPSSPIAVKVKLVTPNDIVVDWKDPAPDAAGYIVEWGTRHDDEFVPLGFFSPKQNTYKHPDLLWETNCFYRVRAIYGPASAEVEVVIPEEISDAEYKRRFAHPEDYRWAEPQIIPDEKAVEKKSIRGQAQATEAAPTDFKATLMPITVSAFRLTWTDNSSDEEGFLIEQKLDGESEFRVVALVEPNINSFGWAYEYPIRKGLIRVRAYYYGKPSDLLNLMTGSEPVQKPADPKPQPAS
jgi:hypothetical protein